MVCICCSELRCQLGACQACNAALKGITCHEELLHFLLSKQTHLNVNLFRAANDPTLQRAKTSPAPCLPEGCSQCLLPQRCWLAAVREQSVIGILSTQPQRYFLLSKCSAGALAKKKKKDSGFSRWIGHG